MIATHIIWTTYGTWLPGDDRGWTDDSTWEVRPPDPARRDAARRVMAADAVELTAAQRGTVEQTIRDHCRIRSWELHALHVGAVHVHVVVSGPHPPREMRDQFKAWCSRKLSDAAGLRDAVAAKAGRKRWFTEGGDTEFIDDERHLDNVIQYVTERQ